MSCDTELNVTHSLSDHKEFVENSVAEMVDHHSNSRIQTPVISQEKRPNVAKHDSVSTSTDKDENYHLSVCTLGNVEIEENDECAENDKMISIIDKETRNNSYKVKFLSFSFARHSLI